MAETTCTQVQALSEGVSVGELVWDRLPSRTWESWIDGSPIGLPWETTSGLPWEGNTAKATYTWPPIHGTVGRFDSAKSKLRRLFSKFFLKWLFGFLLNLWGFLFKCCPGLRRARCIGRGKMW